MVVGDASVLDRAAHSGTQPGCGDCVWTLVLACATNDPGSSADAVPCHAPGPAPTCAKDQALFRLYLTTATTANQLVDEICLGGDRKLVPVSELAAADVDRYLKRVRPPDLEVSSRPAGTTLAGLPTYFLVRTPADLHPETFGGGQVQETITIAPLHYTWDWGDGSSPTTTDDTGGPPPDGRLVHTYATAGPVRGTLTARWGASYTITAGGQTFGPFDASGGLIDHTQAFELSVASAHSHLVSGR